MTAVSPLLILAEELKEEDADHGPRQEDEDGGE